MNYFISGKSARKIYIDNILNNSDKNKMYFDENTVSEFLSELNAGSLFSEPTILILKNANKVKDINNVIKNVNLNTFNDKDVIIDYEANKENKKIKELLNNFEVHEILDDRENKNVLIKYIQERLKCNSKDSNNILEIIGQDFYSLKNEIDKICSYLNGEEFSFDNIKPILSKNTNFFIFNLTEDILNKKMIEFPIKENMALLSSLSNDFEIMYKLHILDIKNINYNNFKSQYENHKFFKNLNPYYVFKKIQFLKNFSKDRTKELISLSFETDLKIKTGLLPLEDGVEAYILEILK
ncbi:hypothetical protein KX935_07520 [Streptobacillus moniliformis]|uniref:DNA polymerase III delta n=1 Tax=Streptobacillus moniliformis (strain ATCC 14647 / DSM 12112 / NCTC 10651 / 9901) TaxID=519441 RepID=D1AX24_STRM9|nr:DNA polymerase III delta [Streptobacillus moniliformis]ACZ00850.1 DNA polymerase III delta [Streptobacillus moniliformis DSM 12112]AVL42759.1 hypothetical protein CEP89_02370 [Streptobacillus moniliformis]QXW65598.1 hypothetical protein KX935_07520 [Streptobacillus moniliformis]SQA14015.1 DNA polymerase III subunit delta [Streptobacillus moniliformis]